MFRLRFAALLTLFAALFTPMLSAQTSTPPMGWNSWDAYGLTITEPQFRANVKVLHAKLQPFGYTYVVIDEGWFFFNPEDRPQPDKLIYAIDANGRYVPVPERFPSSILSSTTPSPIDHHYKLSARIETTSFAPLAAWVHAQGLKFGIHIVRGIPRASVERNLPIAGSNLHARDAADTTDACPWDPTNWGVRDNAAGQAWYDSLLAQYAAWGVDFLKVDCIANNPYKADEIRMIRRAIDKAEAKTGRPMVLSLSPGPTNPAHAEEVASLATMWRISDDFWDVWNIPNQTGDFPQTLKGQFARAAQWMPLSLPPGHYPDLDMLPIGELRPSPGWGQPRHTRLTLDEQRTLMTLWSLNRSPLIVGANLTLLDPPTLKLLTNRAVLRIDQTATSTHELVNRGDLRIIQANMPDGDAIGIFNLGDRPMPASNAFALLPPSMHSANLHDLWTGNTIHQQTTIPPHGCLVFNESQ